MPSIFKDIDVFLCDFHLDIRPLLQPDALKPEFSFLSKPEAYHTAHAEGERFSAGGMEFRPLTRRIQQRNGFWTRHCSALIGSPNRHWYLQSPFVADPHMEVRLQTDLT